ncbi:hypothetical protein [Paracoccus sp. (in: a-proteobacteria)]|uniref:hypothetical protein n=1 Tax=Paracoccus sp. TaxID=267 RepID=UPI00396CE6D1
MTHQEMLAALAPPRLPTTLDQLSLAEMAALLALGLICGTFLSMLLRPLTRSRSRRLRLRDLEALPVPDRLLALARQLGQLPSRLRDPAYGAAPAPENRQIARIARRFRLMRTLRLR